MKHLANETEPRLQLFRETVRKAGVKLTHQRLEIFREIASSREHPDAETVFHAVQSRVPTVSRDTVYRTLWMLNDLGLITTLGPRRESVRFDPNLDHHHHYVCLRCGLARDFQSAALNAIRIPAAAKAYGSVVVTHVEVRGICDECVKKEAGPAGRGKARPPRNQQRSMK